MTFENDLLISYAHVDNRALSEGQPGWVAHFHEILGLRVAQISGGTPKIWRDLKLQGNDYFADTIVEQLPRTAALVAVLSPQYVNSQWCTREVQEFCRASEKSGGLRIGDKSRIFKVVKTPVPLDRHPSELQPLLGYDFFVVDSNGRPRELSKAYGQDREQQFLTRLDDLAYDISKLLELMKNGNAPARATKATIYLAQTSHDLNEEREEIQRDLVRNDFAILPDRQLPLVADDLATFVQGELSRCALSVHLVGQSYGVVPDGESRSVVAVQHEIAAATAGLSRLIWMPEGLQSTDERQQAFIEHLRTDPAVHLSAELLETPLDDLKRILYKKLAPPEPKKGSPPSGSEGLIRVYLVCVKSDLDAAEPLHNFLLDGGLQVLPTSFDEDEAQARLDHEESLRFCDAVLLYYGKAGEPWLWRKLRERQKSLGQGREKPLLACGIYIAPPSTPQKEKFRTLEEALVLREPTVGFSPGALGPFLAEIARRKVGPP
jgi:hypothetical protein